MINAGALHHVEIYVDNLEESTLFWCAFLTMLGYAESQRWPEGFAYSLGDTYLVFVQTEKQYLDIGYHRKRTGLNHLAFHAASRGQVDDVTLWVRTSGYNILYQDLHPYAGGQHCYALYCEDPNRIKVELVAPTAEN